ncbi:hypothetical protein BpHYR1_041458 [Brachionus plicatilis]|uniref:Uncharacterized protein n=1 Tax=Brachionus plicatilis TaxID=10195 RepID=A0A3M7SWU0_BRAPC|nr:hypothetical protein BpHYR1_041458 [Brachionus plicatilis]
MVRFGGRDLRGHVVFEIPTNLVLNSSLWDCELRFNSIFCKVLNFEHICLMQTELSNFAKKIKKCHNI